MRAFITGVTGFVGPYLARLLIRNGAEVAGLGVLPRTAEVRPPMPDGVRLIEADIRDQGSLLRALRETLPDEVYHLAGISHVPTSFENPRETYEVNVGGVLNLLESLRVLGLHSRILNVSTAHVYGSVESGPGGVDERAPIHVNTPYATSKFMGEVLAKHYWETFGLETMTLRPFNHIGPGQTSSFVCSEFARQIALMRQGKVPSILRTGNLEPERDFTDVRDVVEAYWTVARQGVPGETYNVASGVPHRIGEIVELLADIAGIKVVAETEHTKVRTAEIMRLCGNSSKLRALGWEPRICLKESLADLFDYWLTESSDAVDSDVADGTRSKVVSSSARE